LFHYLRKTQIVMTNPEDIAERFWSLAQKPAEEARREQVFLDDVIHKAHLEREIEGRLAGVKTVLDVGAGCLARGDRC
jgi:hypothetical protein